MQRSLLVRCLLGIFGIVVGIVFSSFPAQADTVDSYVSRYLKAREPVPIEINQQGQTRLFSPVELTEGKRLFEENCKNCHVGGATLPNPLVSLSLDDLKAANPARDNINGLVAYLRKPLTYDGSEETFWCRQVPESWMSQAQVENLSAFILRAAERAPGWGTETF
ncbi:Photosystem II protein PsbV, cytochrome c550 [uncultured Synechococcales cyanobacterium]|uniref:Photosystem II protein PsbV, cytochrome c550 n=1 Tax=uncultured Synechococcales cyanobacterium TaxID=1936017 RepID=A0A6J4VPM4_9CYAN|nr:Photosystem II protein PsbV, cytochrome c550 [uncultured Synechococcales cyanobacterium]